MPSLVENLERAAEVNEALEVNIREGHSVIKALRQAIREVDQVKKDFDAHVRKAFDDTAEEKLQAAIDQLAVDINGRLESLAQKTIHEYEKISVPLLEAMKLLNDYAEAQGLVMNGKVQKKVIEGSFFDRL